MAADKNKIIAEATRLVQKGQYDKAIKAYERILAEDRKEVRVLLKVGELHQKKGDNASAAATFNQVAEIYGEQGFFLKAVAVYKQIAKLDPEDVRVNEKLAALYQQLGLMNDAMGQLQVVAAACERTGEQARLLDVLRRMVDLDPENVPSSVKLGELYARAGKNADALELFRRAASQLRENKRVEEYLKVAERIALLAPEDLDLTRELAHAYLSRGDAKRALAKLQLCFKADPKDVETLRLLAQAFRDLGQNSKTVSVYKELARVYAGRGRREEERLTWKLVLDLVPEDAEAREALGLAAQSAAPAAPPPAARPPAAGPPPGPARPETASAATPAARLATPIPRPPTPAPPAPSPRPPGADAISRLLTETDVYVKYGLHQKALEHVGKVLAADPENPDALERSRDIREALQDRAGATEAAERAARVLVERGPEDRARAAVLRLRELAPQHGSLVELAAAAGLEAGAGPVGEDELALSHAARESEEVATDEVSAPPVPESSPDSAVEDVPPEAVLEQEIDAGVGETGPAAPGLDDEPLDGAMEGGSPAVADLLEQGPSPVVEDEPAPQPTEEATPAELETAGSREEAEEALPTLEVEPLPAEPVSAPLELEPSQELDLPSVGSEPPLGELELQPVAAVAPHAEAETTPARVEPSLEAAEPERHPEEPGPAAPSPVAEPVRAPAFAQEAGSRFSAVAAERAREPELESEGVGGSELLDLSGELEEVAFLESQGLIEEALESLQNLCEQHPLHPLLTERLRDLEGKVALQARPPPEDAAPGEAGAGGAEAREAADDVGSTAAEPFDIGRELASELGGSEPSSAASDDFQYSVEDVFDQFKRSLEKAVRPEDSDTHYDLGIAYKEMGLLDDALAEFRTALAGTNRRKEVDVLSMVGVCHATKGEYREAVQAFRRALKSEFLTAEAAKALHYELGVVHEALSESPVAVWYFQKIVKVDPRYRDALARVERLGGGPGQPPSADPTSADKSPPPSPGGPDPAVPGPKKNIGFV